MDHRAFIRANATLGPPPLVPEIRLHLADEALPLWERTEAELEAIGLPPPYWAFAWAGGQAVARYLLDGGALDGGPLDGGPLDGGGAVAGRRVLDFAAGSGLGAIAARLAGAGETTACDIDPFAIAAIELNAIANGAEVGTTQEDLIGEDRGWEVILVGDVFYEKPLAERVLPWLTKLAARGAEVLIGDPGRSYFPAQDARLTRLAQYEVVVSRDLEDSTSKRTGLYRLGG